ncbi:protein PFF0380w-like [Cotesia glomerata]|uniref:protein PFF0380w-like n=1 Tax=Cotesia glomerata TaxID=32391 RepID=UPI001D00B246|nr:protein PFF0380w-like [Cotesia glomerata]XP_044578595.1 protein PFF0380w-like [Cotesia glomerata]XP_044578596.1 protein PFF0380w-like [Cotesia glomerata]
MESPFNNYSLPLNHRKPWDDLTEDYQRKIRKVHYDNILLNSNHNQFQITAVNSNVLSNSGLIQPNEPAVKPAVDESSSIPCNFTDCNENQQSFNNINNNNNNNNNNNFADGNHTNDNDNNDNNDNSNTNNNHSDKNLVNETASENVQIIDRTFSFDEQAFENNLAKCLVNNSINHTQTKAFLDVLRTHPSLTFLLKDSRSLMKTSRKKILTKIVPPGEYLHIGLEFKLHSILSHVSIESIPTELVIDFSTDGAELNKKIQIWPIQIRITNLPFYDDPEHVGIYQGHSKPRSFEEFFDDFITEAENIIKKGGIKFNNMIIPIRFRCFIGDAPARAAVLNHVSHVAKTPCSKCTVEGITSKRSSRFPGINYQCRSDEKYRNLTDVDHHINVSSISKLPINLVEQVPFEYMHLVCLGVTKKLVETVVFGKCKPNKLQQFEFDFLANRLLTLQNYCPREFARIPRELDKIHTFKATEFRQLLLYTFIIASSGIIQTDHYNNFYCYIHQCVSY